MCDTAKSAVGSPRWGALYGVTVPPLATLAVIEMASPPNAVRTILRCALALGTFAGMALWVTSTPRSVEAIIWSTLCGLSAGANTMLRGISPISLGSVKP